MTNPPQGPDNGGPPERGRPPKPPGPPNRGFFPRRQPPPPSESPTRHIPQPGRPQPPSGRDVPRPQQPGRPPGRPPQQPTPRPRQPQQAGLPPNPRPQQPGPPAPHESLTTRISIPTPPPRPPAESKESGGRKLFADRTSMLLFLLIVALLVVAVPIGAELYARHLAAGKVADAVQCEVQDSASVSFAATPPVLWQYLTNHFTEISGQTAGNQVRSAKGMKVSLDIHDINLNGTNNSKGTIGSLNGTITWSADGIKQSIQDAVPVLGKFVAGEVTTNPGEGTVSLKGVLDSATVKPQIVNNGLSLQVVNLSALGSKMSTDTVQKNLDDLTSKATQNYPLGIHADSVKVTDSGVEATFSTSNATIPASSSQPLSGQDCFSGV